MCVRILIVLLALATLGGADSLRASVVTPPTRTPAETLRVLSSHHPLIVLGTVTAQESHYGRDKRFPREDKIIVTDVRLTVERVLKGEHNLPAVYVRIPGGCVKSDNLCFGTDLAPTFQSGEKVIVFLSRTDDSSDNVGVWNLDDLIDGKQTLRDNRFYPLSLTLEEIVQGVSALTSSGIAP